jgi:hypothetical protein
MRLRRRRRCGGWRGRGAAGEVGGVPLVEGGAPVVNVFDFGEGFAGEQVLGVEGGILDAELSHVDTGAVGTVELFGEAEVLKHGVALLEERRGRGERLAGGEGAALREDPGIADGAAGDGDAIDAGSADHVEAVLRCKQVAAAEDGFGGSEVAFHFGQKVPATVADVALDDGTAMDGDGGDAEGERAFDNLKEVITAF